MSHFTSIKTKIKDLEILKRSLRRIGYSTREGKQSVYGYGGQQTWVDLLVKMPQGYNIGFRKSLDGSYEIVADWFGVRSVSSEKFREDIESAFDDIKNEIRRRYSLEKVIKETQRLSFSVVEQKEEKDKTIKLVVRRFT